MELHPVGVSGILAVLGDAISEETGARVAALSAAVRDAHISGVSEMIPAYASLLIKYDPFLTDYAVLADRLRELERHISSSAAQEGRIVDIPVCYGGKYGEDLPFVAHHAGLSEKDVIALHAGRTYRIYMLGFLPGFPYLGGLDSRLFTPRLDTPRTSIPAGSVGIGGQQTGIYPMESPGGWQLIGRTPLTLFSPSQPLPYAAGDRIRFVPIGEGEFEAIRRKEEARVHGA